jgi:hypothetical protein
MRIKVVFCVLLGLGLQLCSYGQDITYDLVRQCVVSKEKSDAIMKTLHFAKGPYLEFTATQVYLNADTSELFEFCFKDKIRICNFWTKDVKLLEGIIAAAKNDGFKENPAASPVTTVPAYTKGSYLLLYNNNMQQNIKSNISLSFNSVGQLGTSTNPQTLKNL